MFHRDDEMTPQRVRRELRRACRWTSTSASCTTRARRSPIGRTFTVEYLGNVVEGGIVKYLNVDVDLMKAITMRTILSGEPVWFGCDTGKMSRRDLGIWDQDLYDYGALYDTEFTLDKAARLDYHETQMTHAMLFTGVDIVDEPAAPLARREQLGRRTGRKGFFVMNDNWFDEYVFEIAARKSYLPPELQEALDAGADRAAGLGPDGRVGEGLGIWTRG